MTVNTISILIITYNRADDLLDLLKSAVDLKGMDTHLKEIIILNNASTDSYDEVKAYIDVHPELKIKYIDSDENLGVARGRNHIIPMASGDLLFTIDDDVELTDKEMLLKISDSYNSDYYTENNIGASTIRVIYYSNKEVQKTAFPHKNYDHYANKKEFLTSYFIGCANIIRKEVFAQTGLYPTDFFYGMEEYDLCYRILDAGYAIAYDGSSTLEHKESPLGRQANFNKLHMQWVNKSKVAWRYLPTIYFISTAIAWSFQYLKTINGHFGAYFKAWGKVLRIPFTEKTKRVSKKTLDYLKQVEARLWY